MRRVVNIVLAGALLFGTSPVSASEIDDLRAELMEMRKEYENKIEKLQTQVDKLTQEQAEKEEKLVQIEETVKKNTLDIDYVGRKEGPFEKGGVVIKSPSGSSSVSLGGYMDHEFEDFENTNSTFDQHRWIINVGAELAGKLRFYSEYEIEHGGTDASGGGEAKVEQAWADYLINDAINMRLGALLVPFGRYNLYHDSDLQDLTDRPIVSRDIIPSTWTESGAGFYGEFNPAIGSYEDLEIGYEVYVVNGLNASFSDTGLSGARGSLESDNNHSKAVVGRLLVSPALGHELGFSGYWGKYNVLDDNIRGGAIDYLTTWGPLELVGEYAYFDIDEPVGSNVSNMMRGYYLQANYHFWPEFLNNTFLGRDFDNPTFTLVGRYDWAEIADDSDSSVGNNQEDRYTLGFNYRPVESWVFKLEYQWNQTKNEALERGNNNGIITSVAMGF